METYKINTDQFESVTSIPVRIVKYFSDKYNLTEDDRKELYESIQYFKVEIEKDFVKQLDESITRFKTFLK
jgi:hypothetical protein